MTFDECVEQGGRDCDPNNMWLQIPFFCGHAAECWRPASTYALEQAKRNLLNNYLIVGVTEQMEEFVKLLELALPRFFKGANDLYVNGTKSHLRKTYNKLQPTQESIETIKKSDVYRMEREFYDFALEQFEFVKRNSFNVIRGELMPKKQQFFYEKIRPR